MKNSIACSLLLSLLFMVKGVAIAGSDYEGMLAHSINRWVGDLELLRNENISSDVRINYLCLNKYDAVELADNFSNANQSIEQGKWLGYTVKLTVRIAIPKNKENYKSWIREQFFLGVAHRCDMNRQCALYARNQI